MIGLSGGVTFGEHVLECLFGGKCDGAPVVPTSRRLVDEHTELGELPELPSRRCRGDIGNEADLDKRNRAVGPSPLAEVQVKRPADSLSGRL